MPQNRYGLIAITPNQTLVNEYENEILGYLSVWEDKFWYDDFFPAWKDDRIGGTRAVLSAREKASLELMQNNFQTFKQKRMEELRRQMSETINQNEKNELEKEYNLLNTSESFRSFGERMGNFDSYTISADFDKYRRSIDMFTDNEDNRKQVDWTIERIPSTVEHRYNLMQGLAFSVANGDKIPTIDSQVEDFYVKLAAGLKKFKEHKDDGWFFREHGREDHKDKLSFSEIRLYAHQANGTAQAYQDALQAILDSPAYDLMRQYYIKKAEKEGDITALVSWRDGNYSDIITYANEKGFIPKKSTFADLYTVAPGNEHNTIEKLAIPALQSLEKAENEYNFFAHRFNEFNQARQNNPQLLKQLQEATDENKIIRLNLYDTKYQNLANNTFNGLAKLMVQDQVMAEKLSMTIDLAAWSGVAVATGGVAGMMRVTAGTAKLIGVATSVVGAVGTSFYKPASDKIEKLKHDICSKSWVSKGLTNLKNSHILDQLVEKTLPEQERLIKNAETRLNRISMDEFDKALAYGLEHCSFQNEEILKFVFEARDLAKLPEEKRQEFINYHQSIPEDKRDETYVRDEAIIQAALTGKYFYFAKMDENLQQMLLSPTYTSIDELYNKDEAKLLKDVLEIMSRRSAIELEADNQQLLINAWKNAGKPNIEVNAAEIYGLEPITEYNSNTQTNDDILTSTDISNTNDTLSRNAIKYNESAQKKSDASQSKTVQNA